MDMFASLDADGLYARAGLVDAGIGADLGVGMFDDPTV